MNYICTYGFSYVFVMGVFAQKNKCRIFLIVLRLLERNMLRPNPLTIYTFNLNSLKATFLV